MHQPGELEPRDDDARLDLDQVSEHGPAAGAGISAAHDEERTLPARRPGGRRGALGRRTGDHVRVQGGSDTGLGCRAEERGECRKHEDDAHRWDPNHFPDPPS